MNVKARFRRKGKLYSVVKVKEDIEEGRKQKIMGKVGLRVEKEGPGRKGMISMRS